MAKISFKHKKKVAFVASGGAIKAACFHVGVCLALEKKGFYFNGGTTKNPNPPAPEGRLPINTYVGSSAGSTIVALLASGYTLKDIVRSFTNPISKRHARKAPHLKPLPKLHYRDLFHFAPPNVKKYLRNFLPGRKKIAAGGIEAFFKNHLSFGGLFTTEGVEQYLRKKALPSNKFDDLTPDLFIVATQLDYPLKSIFSKHKRMKPRPEHHAVYDSSVTISRAAAASIALPPIYQPYMIKKGKEKRYYYDGEIRETLSTHVAKDQGCDLVIASYTHQPYHYHPDVGSLANYGISSVTIQAIYQAIEQKIHTAKRFWQNKKMTLDIVNQFLKDNQFPDQKRKELCSLLERKLKVNRDIDYLWIHPLPHDYRLFLADHFNLSKTHMMQIVKSGFKSALHHLRNYEFK